MLPLSCTTIGLGDITCPAVAETVPQGVGVTRQEFVTHVCMSEVGGTWLRPLTRAEQVAVIKRFMQPIVMPPPARVVTPPEAAKSPGRTPTKPGGDATGIPCTPLQPGAEASGAKALPIAPGATSQPVGAAPSEATPVVATAEEPALPALIGVITPTSSVRSGSVSLRNLSVTQAPLANSPGATQSRAGSVLTVADHGSVVLVPLMRGFAGESAAAQQSKLDVNVCSPPSEHEVKRGPLANESPMDSDDDDARRPSEFTPELLAAAAAAAAGAAAAAPAVGKTA